MSSQAMTEMAVQNAAIACLVITTVFVVARGIARWIKVHHFQMEDYFVFLAWAAIVVEQSLTLVALPILYGDFETMSLDEADWGIELGFIADIMFYLSLWSVKFSLLFLFRRLTADLPEYNKYWYAIMIFTFLTFLGCIVGHIEDCESLYNWMHVGYCQSQRDVQAESIVIYYAFAVDVLTDLLIMVIPVRLLFMLKITRTQKVGVALVFCVGIITMLLAIVRVISLSDDQEGGSWSETWLAFWGTLESGTALTVGCLPAFTVFVRGHYKGSKPSSYQVQDSPRLPRSSNNSREPYDFDLENVVDRSDSTASTALGSATFLDESSLKKKSTDATNCVPNEHVVTPERFLEMSHV